MAQRGPYQTYSDEQRTRALETLRVTGRLDLAAIASGVPKKTLADWRDGRREHGVSSRDAEIRANSEEMIERGLLNVVRKGLAHLDRDEIWDKAGVKDAAIATGIAHTHLRLLRSQPTNIGVHMDLTGFMRSAGYVEVIDTKLLPSGGSEGTAGEETDPDDGGG